MPKKKKYQEPPPTNRFSVWVTADFPKDSQASPVLRWFNLQNCGRETIPLKERASKKHVNHAYNLHRSRSMELVFEVTKEGEWLFVGRKG